MASDQPLRILHAVRAPVGGIFRHILDIANGQADRGHQVGIIADSLTGGERAEAALKEIAPRLKLGVHRVAMGKGPLFRGRSRDPRRIFKRETDFLDELAFRTCVEFGNRHTAARIRGVARFRSPKSPGPAGQTSPSVPRPPARADRR